MKTAKASFACEIGDRVFCDNNWLTELSVEEGTLQIGAYAFRWSSKLKNAAFPASLIVIEADAVFGCCEMRQITFAVGSQLQYIRIRAFSNCPLNEVVVSASIVEIDPSAFSVEVLRKCMKTAKPSFPCPVFQAISSWRFIRVSAKLVPPLLDSIKTVWMFGARRNGDFPINHN
jgi:hypothetical protein